MTSEQLSGWIDGELPNTEAVQAMEAATQHAVSRQTCALYWLIGDCVRAQGAGSVDLAARVMAELENEPTVLAPARFPDRRAVWPQRWLPSAAVAAGVVAVMFAWAGMGVWSAPSPQGIAMTMAAEGPQPVPDSAMASIPAAEDVAGLSDERSYLMAHQAAGVGVPMAGVAQYIRTVSANPEGGQ